LAIVTGLAPFHQSQLGSFDTMSRQTVNLRQHCQPTATNACVGSPPDRTFWGFPGKRCIGARCGVPLAFTSQSPGSGSASAAPIAAYATLENAMFIRQIGR